MVFSSIPQFPWPSSRTPHPTERNYFCIFTSNCPIWKNISAKTARSIQSPIHPYHQHKQINLQLDESLQNTPKKTHFTRHVTTRLSMLEAGNSLIILEPQAFVLKNRWLPRAANGQSSRAAKQNRHKPLFWLLWDVWRPNHFWKMLGWCMMTQPINVHLRKKSGKFFTT